jgi:hypothetical protein
VAALYTLAVLGDANELRGITNHYVHDSTCIAFAEIAWQGSCIRGLGRGKVMAARGKPA